MKNSLATALLLLCALFAVSSLQAKTIFVRASTGLPISPYESWETAAAKLQDAIAVAAEGDEIWVAAGTYYPDEGSSKTDNDRNASFNLPFGVGIYGGFRGNETNRNDADPGANPTILSGDIDGDSTSAGNSYHVITVFFAPETSVLQGFTIQNGNANGANFDNDKRGGAMFISGATPTISQCIFTLNSADDGGAIYNDASDPTFIDCAFNNNVANSRGGAVYNPSNSNPSFTNCTFASNTATSGGAFYNDDASPSISDSSFSGNRANSLGGAILNTNASAPILTNCGFTANQALWGGAITNDISSTPAIRNSVFLNNLAINLGGAIFNQRAGIPYITNSTFFGNEAGTDGGAISDSTNSAHTLINCILWINKIDGASNSISASIHRNSAVASTYKNCLIDGYTAADLNGSSNSSANNLSWITPDYQHNDPLFLLNSPTAVEDLRLQIGSPAINSGLSLVGQPSVDLAGNTRVLKNRIDLGAYEGAYVIPSKWERTAPEGRPADELNIKLTLSRGSLPDSWEDILKITNIDGNARSEMSIFATSGNTLTLSIPFGEGEYSIQFDEALALAQGVIVENNIEIRAISRSVSVSPVHYVNAANAANAVAPYDSWATAAANLQDALAYAAADDQIWVAQGTYYPDRGFGQTVGDRSATFRLKNDLAIHGGFQGNETTLDAAKPAINETILSGNIGATDSINDNSRNILTAIEINQQALLEGFTIQDAAGATRGGGLFCEAASPRVANCVFKNNRAHLGGAIYISDKSNLSLSNASFSGNSGSGNGGAIHITDSAALLVNCSFQGNLSRGRGGAIFHELSVVTMTNCSFQGNHATHLGGALSSEDDSSGKLYNCIVWNNESDLGAQYASIFVVPGTGAQNDYYHSLVEGFSAAELNLTGNSNLEPTDPLFLNEVDPADAPTTNGSLQLRSAHPVRGASPVRDKGNSNYNDTPTDILGNPRVQDDAIDLGAYEILATPTHYVNAANATPTAPYDSWETAANHLQDALAYASSGAGDEIWVAAGTYYPDQGNGQTPGDRTATFQLKDNVAIYGGFTGSETERAAANHAANETILSGNIGDTGTPDDNSYHVVTADGNAVAISSTAILDGFIITAGNANGAGPNQERGAALYNFTSSPTFANLTFEANSATFGGAIYNRSASATFTNCSFEGNKATNGGAIYLYASTPAFTNCSFQGNHATSQGGAIFFSSSTTTLTNCIIWSNAQANDTTVLGSSFATSSSTTTYTNSLVENIDLSGTGTGNLDGTDPANDPRFFLEIDPLTAPAPGGNLRLSQGSPAVDTGNNAANTTLTDLAGNDRIQNSTIDLGAFEGGFTQIASWSFAPLAVDSTSLTVTLTLSSGSLPENWEDALVVSSTGAADSSGLSVSGTGPAYAITLEGLSGEGFFTIALAKAAALSQGFLIEADTSSETILRTVSTSKTHYANAANLNPVAPYDTWETAANYLQDALAYAASGDQVWVAQGTYYPDQGDAQTDDDRDASFQLKNGVAIYGGFLGDETNLADADPSSNETILSGSIDAAEEHNAFNSRHVLTATSVDATAILNGFTVRDGNATATAGGGAILIDSASPTITNCLFQANHANYGGAIKNQSGSNPIFENCSFKDNTSTSFGGAIFNGASSPVFTNCSFQGNSAPFRGGAIYSENFSVPSLTNCSFQGNSAGVDGGAISNQQSSPSLVNCSFQGNKAAVLGGAIHSNNSSSSPTLENCILWNNEAGGVSNTANASIANNADATTSFSHCIVENFTAAELNSSGFSPDTNFEPTNPLFTLEADPATAPTTVGNLQLRIGSPAIDAGDNTTNTATTDLASNDRIQNLTIDLGAYEGGATQILSFEQDGSLETDDTSIAINITLSEGTLPTGWKDAIAIDATGTITVGDLTESGTGPNYTLTVSGIAGEGQLTVTFDPALAMAKGVIIAAASSVQDIQRRASTSLVHYVKAGNSANAAAPYDTWETAAADLQDALAYTVSGDQVWVAAGTYYPDQGASQTDDDRTASFALQSGVALYGGFLGGETDRSAANPAANETVLSGNIDQDNTPDNNSNHILTAIGVDANALLQGFTIHAGNADNNADNNAGGLYIEDASPSIINCIFTENNASLIGGAVGIQGGSSPIFENCVFFNNNSDFGGAVANNSESSVTFTNCYFEGNFGSGFGGAIANNSNTSLSIENCTFVENRSASGAAVQTFAPIVANNSLFLGNQSGAFGGAIVSFSGPPSTFTNCVFQGNQANRGGAFYGSNNAVVLVNCTLQGNKAVLDGGAMYNLNNTLTSLTNCIIWNNEANGVTDTESSSIFNPEGSVITYSHSLVENLTKAALDASGSSSANNFEPTDPLFFLEADPSTAPTTSGNLRLAANSPAIDVGSNVANITTTDLDSNTRIQNFTIDLGAFEFLPFTELPVIVLIDEADLSIPFASAFTDPGATATDATGANISVDIAGDTVDSSIPGASYTLTYDATDRYGNQALQLTRTVSIVDTTTPPVITLRGGSAITVPFGSNWVDPGATATDAIGAAVPVIITGDTVDTSHTTGVFTITYNATDSFDNVAQQVTRQVSIIGTIDFDSNSNNQLDQITWTDDWTLQTSTDLVEWTDVPNAQSPFTLPELTEAQRFWRLRPLIPEI